MPEQGDGAEERTPKGEPSRDGEDSTTAKHLDPVDSTLTNPSMTLERTPPRRGRGRRDLFQDHAVAAASPAWTGNQTLAKQVPNLHHLAKNRRSPPHPWPRGPSDAKRTGVPAGGSTDRPPAAFLTCSKEERSPGGRGALLDLLSKQHLLQCDRLLPRVQLSNGVVGLLTTDQGTTRRARTAPRAAAAPPPARRRGP